MALGSGNDSVSATATLTVGRNVTVYGVDHFNTGSLVVGRSYFQSVANKAVSSDFGLSSTGPIKIGGNFTYLGNSSADEIIITTGGSIGGNVDINLGINTDPKFVQGVDMGAVVSTSIGGNVSVSGGFNLAATPNSFFTGPTTSIAGNTTIDFRGAQSANVDFEGTFSGSVTYLTDTDGGNPATVGGTIGGNLNVQLGNGDNTVEVSKPPAGAINWISGNGSDTLTLDGTGLYLVNAIFGTGTNTLTLSATVTLSGTVIGTGGTNTFNQNGAILAPTIQFINFP
jgi:hypothetical protein